MISMIHIEQYVNNLYLKKYQLRIIYHYHKVNIHIDRGLYPSTSNLNVNSESTLIERFYYLQVVNVVYPVPSYTMGESEFLSQLETTNVVRQVPMWPARLPFQRDASTNLVTTDLCVQFTGTRVRRVCP